ncbi:MAG: hypothetical protein V4501_06030 [Pseudomonadota bacterium]
MSDNFNPEELADVYMAAVIDFLDGKENINEAIMMRGIIIEDPLTKGKSGNNATLDSIESHFDDAGNRKAQVATFTYHEPDRRDREKVRFLSEELSDREKIALAAVYFTAGVIAKKGYEHNADATKCLDAIQVYVANEMRGTKLFAEPMGYKISDEFADKLNLLKERAPKVAQAAQVNATFKDVLQAQFYNISLQKKAILKHAGADKPSDLKGNDAEKFRILSVITAAIDKFGQDYDINKVVTAVADAANQDANRKKGAIGTHHTSELIQKISQLVIKEVQDRKITREKDAPSPTVVSPRGSISKSGSQSMFKTKAHHSTNASVSLNNLSEPPSPKSRK